MIDIQRKREDALINPKEYINNLNESKLSLRKTQKNLIINRKREYLLNHYKDKDYNNIRKEDKFNIINFDASYNKINMYLNSNNPDLISYCLNEISVYFKSFYPDINEQKKIIQTKFLNTLLCFGYKFIEENKVSDLFKVLNILINIQYFEKGNIEYVFDLYSDYFFEFYDKCIFFANNLENKEHVSEIYKKIILIFNALTYNDNTGTDNLNLIFIRNSAFLNILNYIQKKNIKDLEEIEGTIELIVSTLSFINDDILNENDLKIIDKCLDILINELYGSNNEQILANIYRGIRNVSNFDNDYKFNEKIINGGVTLKILKMKFNKLNITQNYLKIIEYSMNILANNLTASDVVCQIIYDQNIIDYYNNILDKFDDHQIIVKYILHGISNISVGSKREVIKYSNIWNEKNIIKYLNYGDAIKLYYIKIVKYLLYQSDFEFTKFVYNSRILKFLMDVFIASNLGKFICFKILKLIDFYLKSFKNNGKETNEYLIIYNQFKDLFSNCEKIIVLREENNVISEIEKRIADNYE